VFDSVCANEVRSAVESGLARVFDYDLYCTVERKLDYWSICPGILLAVQFFVVV